MVSFKIPKTEIDARIERIQGELRANDMDALFVVQRVDLLYFSGTAQNGVLFIPAEGRPLLCVKKFVPRAEEESSIGDIVGIRSVREVPERISDLYGDLPPVVGFELDVMPVNDFRFYRGLFPGRRHVDGSPLIHRVRMIKSPWETAQMERTAEMSRQTFDYMRRELRPGLSEMEFSGMFETFARRLGHGGQLRVRNYRTEGYSWHILSGRQGAVVGLLDSPASGVGTSPAFPCGAGHKHLTENEPILIDFSSVLNGYHLDETRMFAIGSMPDRAVKGSEAAIEIHHAVMDRVKPGITTGELFDASLDKAESLGYEAQYLGPPGHKVSFVGHGIGLELIEAPILAKGGTEVLVPGMTFALEPKMVFEGEFSVGVENVLSVTETGARLISKVPTGIFICRAEPPAVSRRR
jgi:Xaa-Pro aminopeptidase